MSAEFTNYKCSCQFGHFSAKSSGFSDNRPVQATQTLSPLFSFQTKHQRARNQLSGSRCNSSGSLKNQHPLPPPPPPHSSIGVAGTDTLSTNWMHGGVPAPGRVRPLALQIKESRALCFRCLLLRQLSPVRNPPPPPSPHNPLAPVYLNLLVKNKPGVGGGRLELNRCSLDAGVRLVLKMSTSFTSSTFLLSLPSPNASLQHLVCRASLVFEWHVVYSYEGG